LIEKRSYCFGGVVVLGVVFFGVVEAPGDLAGGRLAEGPGAEGGCAGTFDCALYAATIAGVMFT